MSELHELQQAIDKMAQYIAQVLPDPRMWAAWPQELLEALQEKAQNEVDKKLYEEMLVELRDDLTTRIDSGRW